MPWEAKAFSVHCSVFDAISGHGSRSTGISSNIAVQSTEDNITLLFEFFSLTLLYHQLAHLFRHGQALLPSYCIFVLLPSAARRGAHGGEGEVRVQGEEEDEALAYATCCAEDAYDIELNVSVPI